jgi:phospholipid/cholesterol/gamma-HCH transport system permease protein
MGTTTYIAEGSDQRHCAGLRSVGANARFVGETVSAVRDVRTWPGQVATQAWRLGVASLPLATFIALFTGIVLALLASYSFTGAVPLLLRRHAR